MFPFQVRKVAPYGILFSMEVSLPEYTEQLRCQFLASCGVGVASQTNKGHVLLLESRGLSHVLWAHAKDSLLRRIIKQVEVRCMYRLSSFLRKWVGEGGPRICTGMAVLLSGLRPYRAHETCLLQTWLVWRRHGMGKAMAMQTLLSVVSWRLVMRRYERSFQLLCSHFCG
jgi:hypothetical protein